MQKNTSSSVFSIFSTIKQDRKSEKHKIRTSGMDCADGRVSSRDLFENPERKSFRERKKKVLKAQRGGEGRGGELGGGEMKK